MSKIKMVIVIGCIIHGEPGRGNADIRKRSVEKVLRSLKLPVNDRLICFSGTGNESMWN